MSFSGKTWQELLKEKIVLSIDQLKASDKEIQERDTRSIFKPYYELGNLDAYFRRGDKPSYTGNFIPIWFYPLFFDKVIMVIPPYDEMTLRNYCGIGFKELLKLIKEGLLVPLIYDNLEDYKEETFKDFMKGLPKDKPLIRSHLFEDAFYGKDFAFQERVREKAEGYKEILENTEASQISQYKREREKNTLIPATERLPQFIAERVQWQELFGLNKNKDEMEKTLKDKTPLEAYKAARTWHYTVVPKIYSRGGFTILAEDDDIAFTDDVGGAFATLFPERAKKVEVAAELKFPIEDFEIPKALDLVIEIRRHDRKKKEKDQITGSIHKVFERVWNTSSFHADEEFFKSFRKYDEETESLQNALNDFARRARESWADKVAWRERKRYLSGGFSTLAPALKEKNLAILADNIDRAKSFIDTLELVANPIPTLFFMLIKAGLVQKDSPDIQEKVLSELRRLQGTMELWKEEKLETPFIVLKYGLNK